MIRAQESVVEQRDDYLCLDLFINKDLPFFDGHFKDMPVIPGATLLAWVLDYACTHFDEPLYAKSMKQVKFHKSILAGHKLRLEIEYTREKQQLIFTYSNADKQRSAAGSIEVGREHV